jgi:hypothetical protein
MWPFRKNGCNRNAGFSSEGSWRNLEQKCVIYFQLFPNRVAVFNITRDCSAFCILKLNSQPQLSHLICCMRDSRIMYAPPPVAGYFAFYAWRVLIATCKESFCFATVTPKYLVAVLWFSFFFPPVISSHWLKVVVYPSRAINCPMKEWGGVAGYSGKGGKTQVV